MGDNDIFWNCIITAENNVIVALASEIVIMDDSLATVKSMHPRQLEPSMDQLFAFNKTIDKSDLILTFWSKTTCSQFKHDYTGGTHTTDSWVTKATWKSKDLEFKLHNPKDSSLLIR